MTDETERPAKKTYKPRAVQPIHRAVGAVSYEDDRRDAVVAVQAALTPRRKPAVDISNAESCTDRDSRVAYCAELLAKGAWRISHTRELALAWGLSAYRVNSLVTEASRQVADALGGRDRVRMTTLTFLETLAHDAARDGDRRTAVAAMRAISDIAGLITSRVEHTGPDGQPIAIALQQVRQLTNEELEAEIVRAGAARVARVATSEKRELTPTEQTIVDGARLLVEGSNADTPTTD